MWCIPHLLWGNEMGNEMGNEFVDRIGIVVLSKVLALMVIQEAASRHPEIIDESRDQGGARFLFFAKAAGDRVDGAIDRLTVLAGRLGHVKTQENMNEFRTAIDKEVKLMVDAGLAAFNSAPQCFQVEPRPSQPAH